MCESDKMRKQVHQVVAMKPVKCLLKCHNKNSFLSFSKSANIWSMMQNKNNKIEELRKIELSKNQKLLKYDYLYNFVIKFVETNFQK